jgi:DNA-binding transcriptional MerR regulator
MVNCLLQKKKKLDQEWVELILEALEIGISESEIKAFLRQKDIETLLVNQRTHYLENKKTF